jgi:flagellar hook-associated protein 3 FlgL
MPARQALTNLENIRARRQKATAEISTGLRIRRPSDGPVEAGGVVQTLSALESLSQFQTSLQAVGDQLRAADAVLNQAVDLVTRANTLASQAVNFNQTAATRAGISVEIEGIIQNLITIANTEFGGKFLFSGLAEDTRPFVRDPSSPDGVVYRGDLGRRTVAFPGGTETPASLDGVSIFLQPDSFIGSGRTTGSTGAATPNPPVGVGIHFAGGLNATLYVDLPSFFVASAPPTVPGAGDQVTATFTATDGTISAGITATLAGGETTAQIAAALNAQVALTPALAGKITFSDEGGNLKLVESDTAGVGFTFTSSATGGLVTGLEPGGVIGGLSAEEIAAALNAEAALDSVLSAAGVRFSADSGEIRIESGVDTTFTVVDFPRGTGFVSGLAGEHTIGGANSVNVFRALQDLHTALVTNDVPALQATLDGLGRAVGHLSSAQGFYGSTGSQILSVLDSARQFELVNQEKLASLRDADLAASISDLTQAEVNEEAALRVMARQTGRNLFDFLA